MEKLAKKSLILLAMGLTLTAGARAQTGTKTTDASAVTAPSAVLPSADQVLKHYAEAIGGGAGWEKMNSRVSKGTIEISAMNNLTGTIEMHMKAPNSILVVINLGGAVIKQGFDGTTAWSDDPRNGLRVLAGGELEDERREANFYHALDLQKIYSNMTVAGIGKVDDRDAYVIEATPTSGGEPDKMYFDVQSGLEVRSM